MKTRLKLAFVNVVILVGVAFIVWELWPQAMTDHSIGAGYDEGIGARVYLAILMTGIPALGYAVVAYLLLSHFLFKPDELKIYRARRLVERLQIKKATPADTPTSQNHDFAD
jgi:hypothetical protein